MLFIPLINKRKKTENDYDNYLITSSAKISCLEALSVFGINKAFMSETKQENDYFYIPYINSKEKEKYST